MRPRDVDSCRVWSEARDVLLRIAALPSLVLVAFADSTEAATVYVEAGALTASIAAGLRAEVAGTAIAPRPEEADVLVGVRRADQRLDVQVVAASGATILERRVSLEQEVAASVRVVVLLIAEALAATPPPDAPIAPPLPIAEASVPIQLSAGLTGSLWREPNTAQLGPYVAASRDFGGLQLGLQMIFTPCCTVSSQDVVAGSPFLLGLLATGEVQLFEWSNFYLGALVGIGGAWRHFAGEADVFQPDPQITSPQIHNALEFVARAGPIFGRRFGERLLLRLGVGLELRGNRLALVVPEGYPIQGRIDSGLLSPWLDLGLSFALF